MNSSFVMHVGGTSLVNVEDRSTCIKTSLHLGSLLGLESNAIAVFSVYTIETLHFSKRIFIVALNMEKNAFENGVAVPQDLVKLSHVRRDDAGGTHFTNAVRGGLGGKNTLAASYC